ncbi:MAG: RNA-binding S4 domain-containing protein [Desulfocapsaceae bacterium]
MIRKPITVGRYPIRLSQFLKLVGVAQDGLEAKIMIQQQAVSVNNKIETRRGRKLFKDDQVRVDDVVYICT